MTIFDLIHYFCESIKKNRGFIVLFILQLFIRNSTSWFNFKNLIKFISYLMKQSWIFIKTVETQSRSAISPSFKGAKETAQTVTVILFVLVLLKLHNAGIIKLNANKIIALSLIVFGLGLISALSRMKFTKIEATRNEQLQ